MRERLSIGVVAPLVAPLREAQPYGNHIFLTDLARGLAARGHDVVVYAAEGSQVEGLRLDTVPVAPEIEGRFLLLRGNEAAEAQAMAQAFDRLFARLRRRGHDVVTQHAFDREAIAADPGVPTLHTLHLPPLREEVMAAVRATPMPVATVSERCAGLWRDACGREVGVLPNGVPPMPGPEGPVEPVALIAGRISPEKGVATAIRAAWLAGLVPCVVGEIYDPDYYRSEVAPLRHVARMLPALPRHQVRALMGCAAVALMPVEWEEPFGLVAAEAQLAGCPVVGYRRGALPEVVVEGIGGHLVPPGDEAGLVAAIGASCRLDRAAIRRDAEERFGMDACIRRYERALVALGD